MKMHQNIALSVLLAAALISCNPVEIPGGGKNGGEYRSSVVPLKVTSTLDGGWSPLTKTVSEITDIDDAGLQSSGFGVYAIYTGEEAFSDSKKKSDYTNYGIVLDNRKFRYNAGTWENTGDAEFWPASSGENLTLFAYAPWDTWSGVVRYNEEAAGDETLPVQHGKVPYIVYDDYVAQNLSVVELSKQRDILWGTNTSGLPHKNMEKDDYDPEGTVDFHFRHAVAKVRLNVKGSLPGEVRNMTSSGNSTFTNGTAGDPENGETTSSVGNPVATVGNTATYYRTGANEYGWGTTYYVRYYHAIQTQTETQTIIQTRYRTRTETATGAVYSVSGQRYLVEEVTLKGFNRTGTLLLDNASAYFPTWTNVTRFEGQNPEYVLNGSNVLSQSLQYVPAATVQSNFTTYTGVTENAADLMSDYFLYAIPRASSQGDRIAATIKYHKLNVNGTLTVTQNRQILQKQTRTISRTRTRTRNSEEIKVRTTRDNNGSWNSAYNDNASNANNYTFSAEWDPWGDWGAWSNPSWGNDWQDVSTTDWAITSESLTGATVNYNGDTSPHLSGEILTSLEGGIAYDINLILAGDKIELEVVPQPWELKDFDFDYNANINDVIQALTYDSSYIDYADAQGNVYINNRMGKFYFKLGAGKFASWQASLVGDAAFGFCDENGNFLLDAHGNRVASIRNAIDPEVMNYIYIKPVDSEASVTSHAKLRIYYIDATGDAVVALNLVNLSGVTEWTIWQNAN